MFPYFKLCCFLNGIWDFILQNDVTVWLDGIWGQLSKKYLIKYLEHCRWCCPNSKNVLIWFSFLFLQSKDEAVQVLKRAMQEKNLSSEGPLPPPHTDKIVALLEEKVKEREETINSKSERIHELEKDVVDQQNSIDSLKKLVDDKTLEVKVLQEAVHAKDQEIEDIKEKHETELSEKALKLASQAKENQDLEKTIASLKESLAGLESKENVTERLLLLDAEKEQQFRNEMEAFRDSEKVLDAKLQAALEQNRNISEELASAKTKIEAKEKELHDLSTRMGKLKLQAKAKLTSVQNEKEKLSKDKQEVEFVYVQCLIILWWENINIYAMNE